MSITEIFTDNEKNKIFLSSFSQKLLIISILGCILAIIDYHGDLLVGQEVKWTNGYFFGMFCLIFNIVVIIGNLIYIYFSIYRFEKFTKYRNKEILYKMNNKTLHNSIK